jgi:hypothetical protein
MKTVTIVVNGFIGDILFASSIARHLRQYDRVNYVIRHWEPYELLMENPSIDLVAVTHGEPIADPDHVVFTVGEVDQSVPVTIQFQQKCGVEKPTLGYEVFTNANYNIVAQNYVAMLKASQQKKVVAYQANWKERTFGFTKEEYERGIDVPPLGYGGRRRNTDAILQELAKKYTLVEVGLPEGAPNGSLGIYGVATYSMTASLIKNCDWMIGGEGGLTNLAAGVGTKTVITGDFIHQLYGWNGCIKKIKEPKMGPATYFPDAGHVTLDPFLTDEQVVQSIMETIG